VGELAAGLPVSRPAVSQDLKIRKEAELVRERPHWTRHYYEINPSGLDPLRIYLEDFWDGVLEAFTTAAQKKQGGPND